VEARLIPRVVEVSGQVRGVSRLPNKVSLKESEQKPPQLLV